MKAYIAAGWFSDDQETCRLDILDALEDANYDVFSPKDDLLYDPTKHKPSYIFDTNIINLLKCDVIVASTEGKDMGTLFECGYAYASDIPIIYYNPTLKGKFNIMLAESAVAVFSSKDELTEYLELSMDRNTFRKLPYIGDVE